MSEHAEFDEATEFADHLKSLDHRVGMTGRFDVNIAAVTFRQALDDLNNVIVKRIQHHVSAVFFCQFQSFGLGVHDDELPWALELGASHHPQAERSRTGKNDDIIPMDVRSLCAIS